MGRTEEEGGKNMSEGDGQEVGRTERESKR